MEIQPPYYMIKLVDFKATHTLLAKTLQYDHTFHIYSGSLVPHIFDRHRVRVPRMVYKYGPTAINCVGLQFHCYTLCTKLPEYYTYLHS